VAFRRVAQGFPWRDWLGFNSPLWVTINAFDKIPPR
jgi:hypothetical protein